ncbi:MAG: hypothetical protein P8074_14685 [Anaerolineales bacterium]
MQAVWMVRSRQLQSRFRFWLALVGYDRNDKSLLHKIYLVYAGIFYTLWSFAVLSLVAGGAGRLLGAVQEISGLDTPALAATALGALGLLVWTLLAAYNASRTSPLIFSEEDSYLIAQTPADRRSVTLAWLVGQWPRTLLPISAVAVTLGFAILENLSAGNLNASDIPRYLLAGFRSLSVTVFLQLGLLALIWALGAFRLQGDHYRPNLRLAPVLAGILLLLALLPTALARLPETNLLGAWLYAAARSPLLAPINLVLQAGFGSIAWPLGMALAVGWTILGLLLLAISARSLNLSRASQESRSAAAWESAMMAGNTRQLAEISRRKRLALGYAPSALLTGPQAARSGWRVLVMKDLLQISRNGLLRAFFSWSAVFLLAFVGVLVTGLIQGDIGVQAFSLLYWMLLLVNRSTSRLQNDLETWAVFRQLPLPAGRLLLAEIVSAVLFGSLATWAGLAAAWLLQSLVASAPTALSPAQILTWIILAPVLIAAIAMGSAFDVIRQSKSANLLSGYAPQPGFLSLVIGAVISLLSILFSTGRVSIAPSFLGALMALAVSAFSAYALWQTSAERLKRIG